MQPPDRKRLARFQRLEKVRAIAKQTAATAAAEAEGTLAQLLALAERTGRLANDYAVRHDIGDGAALRQLTSFRAGLDGVARGTEADAERARTHADLKLLLLSEAERRRQTVADRARAEAKALAVHGQNTPLSAQPAQRAKRLGTELE